MGLLVSAGPAPTKPPANPPTYPKPPVDTPKPPEPPVDTPKPPEPPVVETVQVPDVTGLTEAEASATLLDKGLEAIVILYTSDDIPKGNVISQLPKASEYVPKGYSVLIMVSTGPAKDMPPGDSEKPRTETPSKP